MKNTKIQNTPFTQTMKMAELIDTNYKLLLLLPRFDIDLGFGELTVRKLCEENNICPELFLVICNVYTFDDYIPDEKYIELLNVQQFIDYLKKSHLYYMNDRLKNISDQLQIIVQDSEQPHGAILSRFFEQYKVELLNHFAYEDEVVFPYVLGIADGKKSADYQIRIFEENHTNIDDKLNDLKNILTKYLHGNSSLEKRIQLIFNLFDFEEDMRKHTLLEDRVLISKVRKMESHYE
ncbi:MAG: hemerythrin domain-containing protein [Bacteroidales bacterium]|nr:hemerythrin domain-containing protein [Bacteroidales bacterium]